MGFPELLGLGYRGFVLQHDEEKGAIDGTP